MSDSRDDHIKVIIRSRPLSEEEKAARTPVLVRCDGEQKSVTVSTQLGSKRGKKTYNFDMVRANPECLCHLSKECDQL